MTSVRRRDSDRHRRHRDAYFEYRNRIRNRQADWGDQQRIGSAYYAFEDEPFDDQYQFY